MPDFAWAVQPYLITFPNSVMVQEKLAGLDRAHEIAKAWYKSTLGAETFPLLKAKAVQSTAPLSAFAPPNSPYFAARNQLGYQDLDQQFYSAFVDQAPETWAGFGGAGDATPQPYASCGIVVKDGDCVNRWRIGPGDPKFNDNIGMLCHELGHLFGLGHENSADSGNNIEYEWWTWPRCYWDNTNLLRLSTHVLIKPEEPLVGYTQADLDAAKAQGVTEGKLLQFNRDKTTLSQLLTLG